MLRRGPEPPAGLAQLAGCRPEITLQGFCDPGDRHRYHGSPAALGIPPELRRRERPSGNAAPPAWEGPVSQVVRRGH
jgi:hypothetical protein